MTATTVLAAMILMADSISLKEVEVKAVTPADNADIIPAQTLQGNELKRLNSLSVADAMRYFAGVQVKDYGGIGGIKTVNVRSMGSNHTAVVYDGVELGNAQNGQIDLGQFSLDNVETLSLYNGQKSHILQPAKDFGSAATVYMRTRTPKFAHGEPYHLRAAFRTGAFDLINPSALLELPLSARVNASVSTEWLRSSGKYKFRYRTPGYDTTTVRQNGDINAMRFEANISGSSWTAKAYHYNSHRGVPGAIVNNVWHRGERLHDANSFMQGSWRGYFGIVNVLATGKYGYYRTRYINNDNRQIKVNNLYQQQEAYLSAAAECQILPQWSTSASYDCQWNDLQADLPRFTRPHRLSHFASVATALALPRFKAQASVLGTFATDWPSKKQRHVVTPALFTSYTTPLPGLALRAFAKQSYRMPTFNDLYYTDIGTANLRPERASQINIGINYQLPHPHHTLQLSADAYLIHVTDKIVAYPKGQQFRWTMLNLGRVRTTGIDLAALYSVSPAESLTLTLRGQYTLQRAIDVTSPSDSYYRHQIPYTPRHSGSVVLTSLWHSWSLNCSWICVGKRYSRQENIAAYRMPPWHTADLSVAYDFKMLRIQAEISNVLNHHYDVIMNYPMPGRTFRLTLMCRLE